MPGIQPGIPLFADMRFFAPVHQFPALGADVLFCLRFDPFRHAGFPHFFQIPDDILMVADTVDNVLLAEPIQPLTGKIGTFEAPGHPMIPGTVPEAGYTFVASGSDFVGQAAVAILRITGTGTAEQAADTGAFFIGNSLHTYPPFLFCR